MIKKYAEFTDDEKTKFNERSFTHFVDNLKSVQTNEPTNTLIGLTKTFITQHNGCSFAMLKIYLDAYFNQAKFQPKIDTHIDEQLILNILKLFEKYEWFCMVIGGKTPKQDDIQMWKIQVNYTEKTITTQRIDDTVFISLYQHFVKKNPNFELPTLHSVIIRPNFTQQYYRSLVKP